MDMCQHVKVSVMCLGPCPLISWQNIPHFDPSHSSIAHQEAELVMDMCQHMADKCQVSVTMSIEFLAKFYPILAPHTLL